jgi:hypothetical protein
MPFRTILGLKFYTGDMPGLLRLTREGGLIVVPSAPVLVQMPRDPAHRAALEGSDFALTDSGFMVLLWRFLQRERLPRISGLKYLRALVESPDFHEPGATFWVMPSAAQAAGDRAWLKRKGLALTEADCYVAPVYPAGPLSDPTLLALLEERRPRYVILCLGGGVQERLGFFLRKNLSAFAEPDGRTAGGPEDQTPSVQTSYHPTIRPPDHPSARPTIRPSDPPALRPSGLPPSDSPPLGPSVIRPPSSVLRPPPSVPRPPSSARDNARPALLCTGAAIAFLSEQQANIPVWADRYMLGWLLRTLHDPLRFFPRYWKALRLVPLLLRYGARPVGGTR